MLTTLFGATMLLMSSPMAQADAAARVDPPKTPSLMTSSEIAAFNSVLDQNHPDYIRCRKILETGSLVKKARVCHTNEKWKQVWATGNQDARDTQEAMTRAPVNGSN